MYDEKARILCFAILYYIQNQFNDFVNQCITKRSLCVFKDNWRVGLSSDGLRFALCPRMCRYAYINFLLTTSILAVLIGQTVNWIYN